ncbi:MAG: 2-dehydro-3-deoxyphosphooctonate aldolase [Elusimicrobia bacterium]|nr:2-dehydro-3-deoxyphosphooctonate aldolase [Elusimicrobiota bacterium]
MSIGHPVSVGSIKFGNSLPFVLIGGPCVIESEKHTLSTALQLKKIAAGLRIPYVFKSSYDKANRSSVESFRGPGLREGLRILSRVRMELKLPVLTDVHSVEEAAEAAQFVDIIQIPAFLCRQTDLLLAAGRTGVAVNVKKGQFMSPQEMKNAISKILSTGNRKILLTERGNSFGYNNLVVDMRGLAIMKSFGFPVIYDATHSVQLPGGQGASSGGQREFILPLARAATGLGVAGLFMEIHPNPELAKSDGPNSVRLSSLKNYLSILRKLDAVSKEVKSS